MPGPPSDLKIWYMCKICMCLTKSSAVLTSWRPVVLFVFYVLLNSKGHMEMGPCFKVMSFMLQKTVSNPQPLVFKINRITNKVHMVFFVMNVAKQVSSHFSFIISCQPAQLISTFVFTTLIVQVRLLLLSNISSFLPSSVTTGQFVSDLVRKPKDHFFQVMAQYISHCFLDRRNKVRTNQHVRSAYILFLISL